MSEEEPEVWERKQPHDIRVKVEGDTKKIRELEEKLAEKDALLESLAQAEFEKVKDELASQHPSHREIIQNIETPSQLETAKTFLEGKKSKPVGVVSLKPEASKNDIMTRPFNTMSEMLTTALEEEKTDPDLAEKIDGLWKKSVGKTSPKWSLQQPSPKIRSPSERYCEYTNSKGYTVLVPQEIAQRLQPEELKKRLERGDFG
jgi:hypothetical protein